MYTIWTQGDPVPRCFTFPFSRDMDATLSADLVHAQEHPWRAQGPRPSEREREGRRTSIYRPRTSGPQARTSGAPSQKLAPQARTSGPMPRTSGSTRSPGHPAPSPEIRPLITEGNRSRPRSARTSGQRPGHPAPREPPDIRPPARTSGACLRAETGLRPMYPSPTYPFVDLDYIYSSPSSI